MDFAQSENVNRQKRKGCKFIEVDCRNYKPKWLKI